MSKQALADHAHRQQALDITDSFIVQAPAGSGKTELLTLRFLKLLSVCEQPEQVLAITFTRKAANEMGRRIVDALRWSAECIANDVTPESALDRQRLEIASHTLAQDKQHSWHLLQNPSRLRVQTIDSFCFYLANQMPVLSQLGGNPRVSDDVTPCLLDAISNTLAQLETEQPISDDIAALLTHLDNDIGKVEGLLIALLHKRDQWLSHILDIKSSFADARIYLQQSLAELVTESLADTRQSLLPYEAKLIPLLNYAAENRLRAGTLNFPDFAPLAASPPGDHSAMPYWHFLAESLLTQKTSLTAAASWRKRMNVNNGFPPGETGNIEHVAYCKRQKDSMHALLESLAEDDDMLAALDYVRILPNPELTPAAWQFLAALTRVLAHLSSELLLSFRKFRVIDYAQASSAARTALGNADAPTDLALALDHRIQHVLVDEFQDTSQMQLEILQQITAGWQPGDGRTLFLVGDAMQSCYAFRNANVGIYLRVRANGLDNIPMTALTLETNFRSQERVVSWVNQVFGAAFPQNPNISRGAVPYTPSVAVRAALKEEQVTVALLTHEPEQQELARREEANLIVARIQQLQARDPGQSIAILVRARPHLNHIIPALRAAGIQWQSTDIDRLTSLPVIEDLLTLTRALLNQADRLAWLALLRAPWCGLMINDLHAVSFHAGGNSIWSVLQTLDSVSDLSADARERLLGILPVLHFAMSNRYRVGLRPLLEHCWSMLGGAAIARDQTELECVAHYFNLVSEHETGAGLPDIDLFNDAVAAAFVPNRVEQDDTAIAPIHLLTMHKAKGLEFDHVILPGLARPPKSDQKPLLQWHQRLNRAGHSRLYLATLSAAGNDADPLYNLLRYEQHYRNSLESTRLLYIAVTRAKVSVQLIATLVRNRKGEIQPAAASLLSRIWRELCAQPQLTAELPVADSSAEAVANASPARNSMDSPPATLIRRVSHPLHLDAEKLQQLTVLPGAASGQEPAAFTLQLEAGIGTLIHRTLEAIGRSGIFNLDEVRLAAMRGNWKLQLRNQVADAALPTHIQTIEAAVKNTVQNPALHWLFTPATAPDEFEVTLTRKQAGSLFRYQIDRSLVDPAGTRWVIDYKTALPAPAQSESDFIAEQCRLYAAQLQNYAALYAQLEQRPVQCALLFTGLGKLVELQPTP